MPAGDAGLEHNHGPLCLARAEQDRLRAERDELRAQVTTLSADLERITADAQHWTDVARQQQAVVDAARDYRQSVIDMMHVMETGGDAWRMVRERRVNAESRMFSGLAALDKAQAAQPEGEHG